MSPHCPLKYSDLPTFHRYHMHDAVYWLAADELDALSRQRRPDPSKYAWVCQASGRHAPVDEGGMAQYIADFHMVQTQKQCLLVRNRWNDLNMKERDTRAKIDTSSEEWMQA